MNDFLLPMLAVAGEPFDSPEYLFEVKWNGVRALAARDADGWCLWGRDRADYTARYPELECLRHLPEGTILDGELVVVRRGIPDLDALLARHQVLDPRKVHVFSQRHPVTYVLFDVLRHQGQSLLGRPLQARRQILQQLLQHCQDPRLQFSHGVIGNGRIFFREAVRLGQEGVMAKHLAGRYLPGRRSAAWRKIKPFRSWPCAIIGFVPGRQGVRSLLVAAPWQDSLRCVANVRAGFSNQVGGQLQALLISRQRPKPVVACRHRALWVEPSLFCQVRFLEWTQAGRLRGARFLGLLSDPCLAFGAGAGPHPWPTA